VGKEAACTLRFEGKRTRGRALLETDEIVFRADDPQERASRLKIARKQIAAAQAKGGALRVRFGNSEAVFERLGDAAERWAEAIRSPKGRMDKLGVKPGARCALIGEFDHDFTLELSAGGARIVPRGSRLDAVFLAAENKVDLARVELALERLADAGAIWIVYPKGRKDIRETDVLGHGRAAGLKDIKVMRFSETHTALKFVIPVSARAAVRLRGASRRSRAF
jgi:hypothetical protein